MRLNYYLCVTCPTVFVVVKNRLNLDYLMMGPLTCHDNRWSIK
jgi:hypothetical protein